MHLTMKDEILQRFLNAQGEPISGQALADEFQVSRTAIWKHMQTLQQEGYEFETVKKRGYKLLTVPDKVDMGHCNCSPLNQIRDTFRVQSQS